MNKQLIAAAALAALMGANMALAHEDHAAHKDAAQKVERERCYGVAKAGKNDCASKDGKNGCSGSSTRDNDPNDWVYLPVGECAKLGGKAEK